MADAILLGGQGNQGNLKDGSSNGSTRSIGSKKEDSSYKLGNYAMAEGQETTASGIASHAEGYGTKSIGESSHAEGNITTASGHHSHTEGYNTTASGLASHAEGHSTTASSIVSHAEGMTAQSGSKAFTIVGVNKINKTYTLDSTEGLAVGDVYSAHVLYTTGGSSQSENYGKITAINGNVVTVDKLWCEGDFATSDSYISNGYDGEKNTFRIITKPNVGTRAIGDGSHAEGIGSVALSKAAHAEGNNTSAHGSWSHAEGKNTKAAYNAHAEGQNTKAYGYISHAEGANSETSGYGSHAEGGATKAIGGYSHAEGDTTQALDESAHAEGYHTTASGKYSHAEGKYSSSLSRISHSEGLVNQSGSKAFTIVGVDKTNKTYTLDSTEGLAVGDVYSVWIIYTSGDWGQALNYGKITAITGNVVTVDNLFCEGDFTTSDSYIVSNNYDGEENTFRIIAKPNVGTRTIGDSSHTEGINTKSLSKGSHSEGTETVAYGAWSHAEGKETKASYCAHSEGEKTEASGNASHAEGNNTTASGTRSHAEGYITRALGTDSHAEGFGTQASGDNSHAEGKSTTASGSSSHAEGTNSQTLANFSHAEGYSTICSGTASHTEGSATKVLSGSDACHAEGWGSTASGQYAHAEGGNTAASGTSSHSEGHATTASGAYSHSEGHVTKALGSKSHAEGFGTQASGDSSHVQGKYNIVDNDNQYADIVGNGTNDYNKSNAYTLDWNGNAWYAGDVYVGSTSGKNKDEGSKKLAKEEYVDEVINKKIIISDTAPTEEENSVWFKPITAADNTVIDYPLEQGISGIWTYRKWNSGLVEMWGVATDLNASYSVGNGMDNNISLPFEFSNTNYCVNVTKRNGDIIKDYDTKSYTTSGFVLSLYTESPNISIEVTMNIHIVGVWKK